MFKDDFKKANDSIHADDELLQKVLSLKPVQKRFNPYKYIPIAAAAVIVLSVTAAVFPTFINRGGDGVIEQYSVTSRESSNDASATPDNMFGKNGGLTESSPSKNESPSPSSTTDTKSSQKPKSGSASAVPKESASPKKSDVPKTTARPENRTVPKATAAPKASVQTPYPHESINAAFAQDNKNVSDSATPSPQTGDIFISVHQDSSPAEYYMEAEKSDNGSGTYSQSGFYESSGENNGKDTSAAAAMAAQNGLLQSKKSVVLSVNYTEYEPADTASQKIYDDDIYKQYSTEEWDNDRYFEYLDFNVINALALPEDFKYIGSEMFTVNTDENGIPSFDNRIFPFEGENGRYVSVITSKNTLTADVYLNDKNYTLSSVYDIPAVVIGTEKGYRCYMVYKGISFVITAENINEEELTNILASIAEN